MLAAFRGRERAGLLTTPVMKYFRLSVPEASPARTVLSLQSGDPLVVEGPAGRGRVVVVATSTDAAWSGLPASPAFLPLIQEMLGYLLRGQTSRQNVEVGQALEGSTPVTSGDATLTLQPPQGPREPVPLRVDGHQAHWTFADTSLSGIYAARQGTARGQLFAVNLNTAESDLEPLGIDELRRQWGNVSVDYLTGERAATGRAPGVDWRAPGVDWRAPGVSPGLAAVPGLTPGARQRPIHLGLLYAALGLLLLETVLAWRWGHHES